jgi:hypothetical protein
MALKSDKEKQPTKKTSPKATDESSKKPSSKSKKRKMKMKRRRTKILILPRLPKSRKRFLKTCS